MITIILHGFMWITLHDLMQVNFKLGWLKCDTFFIMQTPKLVLSLIILYYKNSENTLQLSLNFKILGINYKFSTN